MGSGIKGPGSGITSRGIGIRDQVFRQKIKYHKMTKFGLIGRKELPPLNSNVFLQLHLGQVRNCVQTICWTGLATKRGYFPEFLNIFIPPEGGGGGGQGAGGWEVLETPDRKLLNAFTSHRSLSHPFLIKKRVTAKVKTQVRNFKTVFSFGYYFIHQFDLLYLQIL